MTSHLSQPCGKRGFSRMRALPTKVGWLPILAIWNKPKKHPEMDIKHEKKKQKLRHAYRGIQLTSIIINFGSISTSFWTPDFFLDHAMPFAFRPVIFERHRPGPHNCERARWPWAGRALEGKGEEAGRAPTGGAKMVGFFHPKKWTPKKCIRTFPNNPLLGSPAIGFFCHPNWGLLWWVTPPPPKKWQVPFLVRMTLGKTRGSYFFEDPEIPTPRKLYVSKSHPSVGAMRIFGLEADGDWCMMPLVSL